VGRAKKKGEKEGGGKSGICNGKLFSGLRPRQAKDQSAKRSGRDLNVTLRRRAGETRRGRLRSFLKRGRVVDTRRSKGKKED